VVCGLKWLAVVGVFQIAQDQISHSANNGMIVVPIEHFQIIIPGGVFVSSAIV
jgi:hypothetical protein